MKQHPSQRRKNSVHHLVKVEGVRKTFGRGEHAEEVIKGVSLEIHDGDFMIFFGPSGGGKSTLLNLIIGLEVPTAGSIWVAGSEMHSLHEDGRARLRGEHFGVMYQYPIWMKSLTVIENVALPLLLAGKSSREASRKAAVTLDMVGMGRFDSKKPTELSGGQQQRVSLARAMAGNPRALVLDEPTGSLDTATADQMFSLLQSVRSESGCSILMVTHNPGYLEHATRIVRIQDGVAQEATTHKGKS